MTESLTRVVFGDDSVVATAVAVEVEVSNQAWKLPSHMYL